MQLPGVLAALGPYYGLDYLASATAIGGMYLLGNKSRLGFCLYALSSAAMIGLAVLISSPPILLCNGIALAVTLRGFVRWRADLAGDRAAKP